MSFTCMKIKNDFHINGFALCLAFKKRLGATRKWTILNCITQDFCTSPAAVPNVPGLNNICCTVKGTAFLYNQRMALSTFHLFQRQRMT